MQEIRERQLRPALRELVSEASRALARLDADRLEELALSCQVLNRDLALPHAEGHGVLAREAHEAAADMAVFARVLEVTRANLNVMNRLRALHRDRLEYREPAAAGLGWVRAEGDHGDN
jgi:hypothetical protein